MIHSTQNISNENENQIELANVLTLQAIEATFKAILRSNRTPDFCG